MNSARRAASLRLTLGVLAVGALGCASATPCVAREDIALRLHPSKQLNQDRDGYARSVVVRLYQLDAAEPFRAIGFDELWHAPRTGTPEKPVVVAPDELTLVPGKREQRRIQRAPGAAYLALVANFREHQPGSGWQVLLPLPKPRRTCVSEVRPLAAQLDVELRDYGLRVR